MITMTRTRTPDDNEAPARPKRNSRLRSLSFCCLQPNISSNDIEAGGGLELKQIETRQLMSPITSLRRKAARATRRKTRGTVTLHPPRREVLADVTRLSRRAASNAFVEPDEASLRALRISSTIDPEGFTTPYESPTKKRKEKHPHDDSPPDEEISRPRDPITLEELGAHQYVFTRQNGTQQAYNVESLVDYILASGIFSEPVSRIAFSDEELKSLDQCATSAGLKRESVFDAKKNIDKYTAMKQAQDLSFGIDRMVGDIVAKMMNIIEQPNSEEAQMELTTGLFPEFEMFFGQLRETDPAFAKQCGKNYVTWIRGPPNKPTRDESGMLEIVTDFIGAQANIGRS